jgi:hypothetical protein
MAISGNADTQASEQAQVTASRLQALRGLMAQHQLDAYLIPASNDGPGPADLPALRAIFY